MYIYILGLVKGWMDFEVIGEMEEREREED